MLLLFPLHCLLLLVLIKFKFPKRYFKVNALALSVYQLKEFFEVKELVCTLTTLRYWNQLILTLMGTRTTAGRWPDNL